MGNPFTDFVKEYAKKNNMTYMCALPDAAKEWQKGKKERMEKAEKEKKDQLSGIRQRAMKDLNKMIYEYHRSKKTNENKTLKNQIKRKYKGFSKELKSLYKEKYPKEEKYIEDNIN